MIRHTTDQLSLSFYVDTRLESVAKVIEILKGEPGIISDRKKFDPNQHLTSKVSYNWQHCYEPSILSVIARVNAGGPRLLQQQ